MHNNTIELLLLRVGGWTSQSETRKQARNESIKERTDQMMMMMMMMQTQYMYMCVRVCVRVCVCVLCVQLVSVRVNVVAVVIVAHAQGKHYSLLRTWMGAS